MYANSLCMFKLHYIWLLSLFTLFCSFSLFLLLIIIDSITEGIRIDIDFSLEDYSLSFINPISYQSIQNAVLFQNEDSSMNSKKQKNNEAF